MARGTRSHRSARPPARSSNAVARYLRGGHDPLTSLVLTVPVFLVYHLGILLVDLRNGVDLVSGVTFALLDYSVAAYVAATLSVAAGLVLAAMVLRRRAQLRPVELVPILAESSALALLMLVLVGWATSQVFATTLGPSLAAEVGGRALGPLEKVVLSAGAGFHEELVFRVGLFAGLAFVLVRVSRLSRTGATVTAALTSAVLFSAVHYLGPLGDPFALVSFTFRFLAGLYLAAVYAFRGFAVAVYTHTLYDLLVFFFR